MKKILDILKMCEEQIERRKSYERAKSIVSRWADWKKEGVIEKKEYDNSFFKEYKNYEDCKKNKKE